MDYDYDNNVLKVIRFKYLTMNRKYKGQAVSIFFTKKELDLRRHQGDKIIMTSANSLLVVMRELYHLLYTSKQ